MGEQSVRELKSDILVAISANDRQRLVDLYTIAAHYYQTDGARLVDRDASEWSEINEAIEQKWGEPGLAEIKRVVGTRVQGPKQRQLVEEAVARAMRDGRLPS